MMASIIATGLTLPTVLCADGVLGSTLSRITTDQLLQNALAGGAPGRLSALELRCGAVRGDRFLATCPLQQLRSSLDVDAWFKPPDTGVGVIEPMDLVTRFRELRQNLGRVSERLVTQDERLRSEVQRRANDPNDLQLRRTTSGLLAEKLVEAALNPYFRDIQVQVRVEGGGTVIDIVASDARKPMIIGPKLSVRDGGSLAVEVKVGSPEYLAGQLDKIANRQVPGHHTRADTSIVITSKDIYDIPGMGPEAWRNGIDVAGSRVYAFLPKKAEIDAACANLVHSAVQFDGQRSRIH